MITTNARVVSRTSRTTFIDVEPAGCSSCVKGCQGFQKIEIPGDYYHDVEVSVSMSDQLVLLTHSLVQPLLGFIIGGMVSHGLQMSEPLVIAGSLSGLLIGITLCKVQTHDRLKLIEVIKQ